MQKVLDVIKKGLFFLCCFIKIALFSQNQVIGVYSSIKPLQEHYRYFKFKPNGTFEYHFGASLGDDEYGEGHYSLEKDKLILNYNLTKPEENSFYKFKLYKNSDNSVKVKIRVFDLNKKPLYGISVIGNIENEYGVETNKKGLAQLYFKKQNTKQNINISDLCCGNFSFKVDLRFNYIVDVFLKKRLNNPIGIKGEIISYKIVSVTKDTIILKDKKGKFVTWVK